MFSSMNSSRLFFFKSEHDSLFPCSEIIDTFKLLIKLGANSHLACINKNDMLKLKTDNRYLPGKMSFPPCSARVWPPCCARV